MIELLKGISCLKSLGIYHRDIKPHNFLYNSRRKKGIIIDFGLAEIDEDVIEEIIEKKYKQLINRISRGEISKCKEVV
jgi:cell division control protein 7